MLDAARRHLLRILGPNCLGLIAPHAGSMPASPTPACRPAPLAFVSQSGALVTAMLDWAQGRGIGFSHCVSWANRADVDFADLLDWLASDGARGPSCSTSRASRAAQVHERGARGGPQQAGAGGEGRAAARRARRRPRSTRASWRPPTWCSMPPSAAPACCAWTPCRRCSTPPRRWPTSATPAPGDGPRVGERALTLVTNGGGAGVMAADAAAAAGVPWPR
jgi:acetyltransferase